MEEENKMAELVLGAGICVFVYQVGKAHFLQLKGVWWDSTTVWQRTKNNIRIGATYAAGVLAWAAYNIANERGYFGGGVNGSVSKNSELSILLSNTLGNNLKKNSNKKNIIKVIDEDEKFISGLNYIVELLRNDDNMSISIGITDSEARILANNLENILIKGDNIYNNTIELITRTSENIFSNPKRAFIPSRESIHELAEVFKMEAVQGFYIKNFDVPVKEMKKLTKKLELLK